MSKRRFLIGVLLASVKILAAGPASSQDYPNKPIRMLTSAPGGGADIAARMIADGTTGPLGQPMIIENRSSGVIAAEVVSKATPDGYTLALFGGDFWLGPLLQKMPYDPVKDFSPVTLAVIAPNILVVHPSVAANSVKELIGLAQARPGVFNYASGASGGSAHLAAELFKSMARVNIVRIPYKGTGPAVNGLVSGEVQLMFPNAAAVTSLVKSGKLKALAITSAEQSAVAPGLPTVAASGLPGFESASKLSIFVPAKTPVARINRLNQEIVRFLKTAEAKEKILNTGGEAAGSSPAQLAAAMRSEVAVISKLINDVGIKAE